MHRATIWRRNKARIAGTPVQTRLGRRTNNSRRPAQLLNWLSRELAQRAFQLTSEETFYDEETHVQQIRKALVDRDAAKQMGLPAGISGLPIEIYCVAFAEIFPAPRRRRFGLKRSRKAGANATAPSFALSALVAAVARSTNLPGDLVRAEILKNPRAAWLHEYQKFPTTRATLPSLQTSSLKECPSRRVPRMSKRMVYHWRHHPKYADARLAIHGIMRFKLPTVSDFYASLQRTNYGRVK